MKLLLFVILMLTSGACYAGSAGDACHCNSTCNDGLKCVDEICVTNNCSLDTSNLTIKLAFMFLIVMAVALPAVILEVLNKNKR